MVTLEHEKGSLYLKDSNAKVSDFLISSLNEKRF